MKINIIINDTKSKLLGNKIKLLPYNKKKNLNSLSIKWNIIKHSESESPKFGDVMHSIKDKLHYYYSHTHL